MQRLKTVLEHRHKTYDKCFLRYCKCGLPVETDEGAILIPLFPNLADKEVKVLNTEQGKEEWWHGDTDVYLLKTEMNCSRIESKPC